MGKVLVIGGGAAGMMAAIFAARKGHEVVLFEQNEKLGKKIYITGKGRCNLTNDGDAENFFANIMSNPRFMYSAFYDFSNLDTISFFQSIGLKTKVERGQRVFPVSDHSSDVIRVLENELKRQKVQIKLQTAVVEILTDPAGFCGVRLSSGSCCRGDYCIIATGGLSYPTTGATGDGFRFAKSLGHSVTPLYPALVSIRLRSDAPGKLEGLALKNIGVSVTVEKRKDDAGSSEDAAQQRSKKNKLPGPGKVVYEAFGEMVFTAHGVSGPVILSASSKLADIMQSCHLLLHLDLKPALSEEELDARILKDFDEARNKQYKNALDRLLPQKIIPVIIDMSGISPEKQVNTISKEERKRLVYLLKNMIFPIASLGGYEEAVITKGGIQVKEINPSTMESKLVPRVYFAGEVLDVDALTGGYNLQVAWSTGHLAGDSIPDNQDEQ